MGIGQYQPTINIDSIMKDMGFELIGRIELPHVKDFDLKICKSIIIGFLIMATLTFIL